MSSRPIEIVGGGLAGLALGIGLRTRGIPAAVWEASPYPRHRVCGEVISGRGCDVLNRLQLLSPALAAGATWARTAAFYAGRRSTPVQLLPKPALCISRYTLDQLLAQAFQEAGGEIIYARWQKPVIDPGVVRASGRPAQALDGPYRWFGLKAHVRNVALQADVEMHLVEDGYVGLCRLSGGVVNVCGLFRSGANRRAAARHQEYLRGPPDSALHARLATAEWDAASFCAVAALPLRPRRATDSLECRLGDALTMISPVTGNGMSMALEAAEWSTPILAAFSSDTLSWPAAQAQVAATCDGRFARRLRWAEWLHQALFRPAVRTVLLAAGQNQWAWRLLFTLTR